jgi:hypothetical protein
MLSDARFGYPVFGSESGFFSLSGVGGDSLPSVVFCPESWSIAKSWPRFVTLFFVQSPPAPALPREPNPITNAIGYAKFYSRSHDAVIRVYDAAGNVIETHEHAGDFKE